jgi:hypothetical protein
MSDRATHRSDRVKLVYNAQIDSPAGMVLDYLLNNSHFTSRQGRQQAIEAISAFYRPLAAETREDTPRAELQAMARNCVEVLAKQIDVLCTRYQIESPMSSIHQTTALDNLDRLETILANGLQAIAQALQSSSFLPTGIAGESFLSPPCPAIVNFEQGVRMEGNELGELGLLLEDDDAFSDLAA